MSVPSPLRECEPNVFGQITDIERRAQSDMQIRGHRLAAFRTKTDGHVWQQQDNGEWWLVPVVKG